MNKRYQLIKPILSEKIYESSSMLKGAKKCYKEVKNYKIPNADSFTIRDIDTNKTFVFKIHHPYIPSQLGGELKNGQEGQQVKEGDLETLVQPQNDEKIAKIEENIKNLESRIGIVENTVVNAIDKYNEKNIQNGNNGDECVIM